MNGHDDFDRDLDPGFERDVRETLNELGSEHAPTRLLVRVRAIPSAQPAAPVSPVARRRLFTYAGLAAAAVVAAIVLGGLLLPVIYGPAAPLPTTGAVISPSAIASPSQPGQTASASVTASPTAAPSPTPTPEAPLVVGGPVPAGFQPLSVTFASPVEGWVLGTVPCATGRCTIVVHSADAGVTWTFRGSLPAGATGSVPAGGVAPVETMRFADPDHGWAYGSQLWVTNDGGATWTQSSIQGFESGRVYGLEVARGIVHAVGFSKSGFVIATSQVGSGPWQLSAASLPVGGSPVPSAQLVLSGGAGWVLQNDRTVVNGARFSGGAWSAWTPPCADLAGPALLAASSNLNVLAVCDVGLWSTPAGVHLFVSSNGGASFAETGPALPLSSIQAVATPAPATIVVAGAPRISGTATASPPLLTASFDGGQSWSTVLTTSADRVVDLGFTTTTQGVAIAIRADGSQLFMTRDGGHTWSTVRFS